MIGALCAVLATMIGVTAVFLVLDAQQRRKRPVKAIQDEIRVLLEHPLLPQGTKDYYLTLLKITGDKEDKSTRSFLLTIKSAVQSIVIEEEKLLDASREAAHDLEQQDDEHPETEKDSN